MKFNHEEVEFVGYWINIYETTFRGKRWDRFLGMFQVNKDIVQHTSKCKLQVYGNSKTSWDANYWSCEYLDIEQKLIIVYKSSKKKITILLYYT
jgi:hypothetical protein